MLFVIRLLNLEFIQLEMPNYFFLLILLRIQSRSLAGSIFEPLQERFGTGIFEFQGGLDRRTLPWGVGNVPGLFLFHIPK